MFNPASALNAANTLSSASLGMANVQSGMLAPQSYPSGSIGSSLNTPPTSNTTYVELVQADNGWILHIKNKTLICSDLNDLSQQLVAAMVADRMEK